VIDIEFYLAFRFCC